MERMAKDQPGKRRGRGARASGAEGLTAAEPSWVGCSRQEEGESCPRNPGTGWVLRSPSGGASGLSAGGASPARLSPAPQYQPGSGDAGELLGAGSRRRPLALFPADRLALFACRLRCLCQQNAPNTRIAAVISALSLLKLLLSPD